MRGTAGHSVLELAAALVGAAAVMWPSVAAGDDGSRAALVPLHDVVGTLSCMSASCHGGKELGLGADGRPRNVYVHWLGGGEGKFQEGRRGYDPRAVLE